jgi:glucose-1-phosphate adenylyltransferase
VILAGGEGHRLQPLTLGRSKAAVPFAGKYRIIDFTLSNCLNSGIRQIYVLTQYMSGSLNIHIQEGWGISLSGLGEFVYVVPPQQKMGLDWYRGTADALRQNLDLINRKAREQVLVLSGDHIYKMDYRQIINYHRSRGADLTIAAVRVPRGTAAGTLGVLEVDDIYRLIGFEEKPQNPRTLADDPESSLASMAVYVFNKSTLNEMLHQSTEDDFGKGIIPAMLSKGSSIAVYDFMKENRIEDFIIEVVNGVRQKSLVERTKDSAYWRDVGTIDSYYEASMDLVGVDPIFNLYGEKWPFRTYQNVLSAPSKFILGGNAMESLVSAGCIISGGYVWRSIISPHVIVERDSIIQDSIIFDRCEIQPGAKIKWAIVDKEVTVHAGATLGVDLEKDKSQGCMVSEKGIVVVPKGLQIKAI